MPERTDHSPDQPSPASLTPQPNRILAVPATVENCRADFDAAAGVRQTMAQQEAGQRR